MGEYVKERSASPRGDWFRAARFGMFIHWGFELLRPDDQRIRPKGVSAGDVVKIDLAIGN